MNCEAIGELLPDYLQAKLNPELSGEVEKHLAGCPVCGEEVELWKKLAVLPDEQPSPVMLSRFRAMLESYEEGRWEKTSLAEERRKQPIPMVWGEGNWRVPISRLVWACVFLVCGFFIGKQYNRGDVPPQSPYVAELRTELAATRQIVALSMLQQQSASQRLEGVSWSRRLQEPDPQVLNALLHTLRFDSSVDVRLAALDALSRYAGQPEVRRELINALESKQSPLVQVAVVDLLVDLHDRSAVPHLKQFQQEPRLDPAVRKRVDWGIQQLN